MCQTCHLFIHFYNQKGESSDPALSLVETYKLLYIEEKLFAEVSSKETFECFSVSRLVTRHLMNCVMDCIEI